jgi:hypothetical protein
MDESLEQQKALEKLLANLEKNEIGYTEGLSKTRDELEKTAREQNILDAGVDDPIHTITLDDAKLADSDSAHRAENSRDIANIKKNK